MSFGFSVGDFLSVGSLALRLYFTYKDGPSDFRELCRELLTLHTTLEQLQLDIDDPTSIIARCHSTQQQNLVGVVRRCQEALVELEVLKTKYTKLDGEGKTKKLSWTRMKYVKEDVGEIRHKLSTHLNSIAMYLAGVGHASLSRIEQKLETLGRIEAKIDALFQEIQKTKDEQNPYTTAPEAAIILASDCSQAFPWGKAHIDDEVDEIIDVLGDNRGRDGISKDELEEHRKFIGALVLWKDGKDSNAMTISKPQKYDRHNYAHSYSGPQSRGDEHTPSNRGGRDSGMKRTYVDATPATSPAAANAPLDQPSRSNYHPPQVEDDDEEAEFSDGHSVYSDDFFQDRRDFDRGNTPKAYYSQERMRIPSSPSYFHFPTRYLDDLQQPPRRRDNTRRRDHSQHRLPDEQSRRTEQLLRQIPDDRNEFGPPAVYGGSIAGEQMHARWELEKDELERMVHERLSMGEDAWREKHAQPGLGPPNRPNSSSSDSGYPYIPYVKPPPPPPTLRPPAAGLRPPRSRSAEGDIRLERGSDRWRSRPKSYNHDGADYYAGYGPKSRYHLPLDRTPTIAFNGDNIYGARSDGSTETQQWY